MTASLLASCLHEIMTNKELSVDEILRMLTENGNLVKRPFVVGDDFGTTGFKEEVWDKIFK